MTGPIASGKTTVVARIYSGIDWDALRNLDVDVVTDGLTVGQVVEVVAKGAFAAS